MDSLLLARSFFVYYKKMFTTNMCKVHVKTVQMYCSIINCATFVLL